MPARKKSASELRLSQPRAGRLAARIREEGGTGARSQRGPDPQRLADFQERIKWSARTFTERMVPGEPVLLEFGKVEFNWRTYAYLTIALQYAARHKEIPACSQFLEELDSEQPQFFMDPTATEAIGNFWFPAFHDSVNWELTSAEVFDLVRFVGWKNRDGSPRYPDSFWESNRWRNVLAAGFKEAKSI